MWAVVLVLVAVAGWCGVSPAHGANILAAFPMEGKSHWIVNRELLVTLSSRGHRLTVVTPFHQQGDPWEHIKPNVSFTGGEKFDFLQYGSLSPFTQLLVMFLAGGNYCERLMEDASVQELINSQDRTFDLLIMETFFHDCFLAFAHKYKIPIVLSCAFGGGSSWTNYLIGNPYPLSYLPEGAVTYGTSMNVLQKTYNVLVSLGLNFHQQYFYFPALDKLVQKHFKDPTMPPLAELERNTSLLLLNNHFSFDYARPLVPNAVQVAGMHIRPPKKLPLDLQKFMDAAEEGVIYFSMGSNIQSSDLTEEMQNVFLKTFAKLKQKVLWKFEVDSLPNQPANLKISKWFPQSDLLAHKNMRLFITHGGMMSLQEALYSGVPLLGFPIFGDQGVNLLKARDSGYGLMLHIHNITEESFGWAVNELLTNPRYMANAKKYSQLFHDRPEKPLETAVRSVEYVLRHGGARHVRSAALDLAWYQYWLLDVAAFLLASALSVAVVLVLTVKFIIRTIFRRDSAVPKTKKKTAKKD